MLTLFEIQQLFSRLLTEADPTPLLTDLDPLTLEMIKRLAEDHDKQLDYFHHLKFDRGGSEAGSFWHASTCVVSVNRLLDAIHVMTYDRPTIERHLSKLPVSEIALYYAYLNNAGLYHPVNEFDGVMSGHAAIAKKHDCSTGTFRNAWDKVCTKNEREGATNIVKKIERIRHYLPPEARQIAERELADLK